MQETDHIHEDIHPKRPTRPTRARLFTIAAVASGILVAGCGGSSPSATTGGAASSTASAVANAGAATISASSSPGSSPSPAQPDQNLLNFARCMRANGVPNFPDPKPGGGFRFPASPAPAFAAAKAKCQKLLPNGGAPPQFDPQALVPAPDCDLHAPARRPWLPRPRQGSHDGTVRAPTRRQPGSRLPRGPARVPGHARHKLAGVRAGGDCVRRRRDPQGPLIKARNRPGNHRFSTAPAGIAGLERQVHKRRAIRQSQGSSRETEAGASRQWPWVNPAIVLSLSQWKARHAAMHECGRPDELRWRDFGAGGHMCRVRRPGRARVTAG